MPKQPRTSANKCNKLATEIESSNVIPYATGYKPPTDTLCRNAIGFGNQIPFEYDPSAEDDKNIPFFKPVPDPVSADDWLAQYCEEGQTFKQFLSQCPWLSTRKRKYMSQEFTSSGRTIKDKYPEGKIYIVPVGDMEKGHSDLYSSLIEYTEIFLGLPVVSLPQIKLEIQKGKVFWLEEPAEQQSSRARSSRRRKRHELNTRYNKEWNHCQMCVDSNLMQLRKFIPEDALCMIGLTMMDLYGDESDLFVAGMAAGNQRVAIFSLYRYDPCLQFNPEYWFVVEEDGKMPNKERQRITLHRGCKLLVHEICHLLGIDHCIYYACCMNGSGHLQEDFRQPMHLCPVDLHKLSTLVGFNVLDRYKALLKFYEKHNFKEETDWVNQRISCMQSEKAS